jgi:hypothetical protein
MLPHDSVTAVLLAGLLLTLAPAIMVRALMSAGL